MLQAITQDQSATLGGVYILVVLALVIGGALWFNRRFGERVRYNQRRRQVEADMHRHAFDRRIAEDVADEWGYDSWDHHRPEGR